MGPVVVLAAGSLDVLPFSCVEGEDILDRARVLDAGESIARERRGAGGARRRVCDGHKGTGGDKALTVMCTSSKKKARIACACSQVVTRELFAIRTEEVEREQPGCDQNGLRVAA